MLDTSIIKPIPDDEIASSPDMKTESELNDYDKEKISHLKEENKDLKANRGLRLLFGWGSLIILGIWSIFVFWQLIMVSNGNNNYNSSDTVMVALLSSTSANIIALSIIIARGLFNVPK